MDTQEVIQNHVNGKAKFKSHSPPNLRTRCYQAREPRGTRKSTNISYTFDNSYQLVFDLRVKRHIDAPMRESDNILNRGT